MGKMYKLLRKQGIGGIGDVVVHVGDPVRRGELLARASGLGANLHASVDGTVFAIDDEAIVIEADQNQREDYVPLEEQTDPFLMLREAGLVGMGGAGFPTATKLETSIPGGFLIVNAVECEPFLSHNIQQAIDSARLVLDGAVYAKKIVKATRIIVAIKEKNQDAIAAFQAAMHASDGARIVALRDMYPMGEERAVIRETLGKLLGPSQLPSAANAVVCNLETLASVARAIAERRPVISKNLTVIGHVGAGKVTKVFRDVPIGTPILDLIEAAGGLPEHYGEIIIGGPFTGRRMVEGDVVTKTTGAIIVTEPFPDLCGKPIGLLVCACGANEARLREIAESMHAVVVDVESCKQAVAGKNGALKCENPGICPGQAEKVLNLKKAGAEAVLIANCTDCSNTVMGSAPKLGLDVYHSTDHVMRTMGHALIRRMEA